MCRGSIAEYPDIYLLSATAWPLWVGKSLESYVQGVLELADRAKAYKAAAEKVGCFSFASASAA